MDDEITPVGDTQRMPKVYESVTPHLARLLLEQKLLSVDGKTVTVDEFSSAVEKATSNINSKKIFLQLQLLRPDFVQFLMDREVWETFCEHSIDYFAPPTKMELTIINHRWNSSPDRQSKLQALSKKRSSNR